MTAPKTKKAGKAGSTSKAAVPATIDLTGATAGTGLPAALQNLSIRIVEETHVRASIATTFEALLEELGPGNLGYQDVPMPLTLEAWPGGRWFRDLGADNGHLWGHVQAIKRPTLIEIVGPLMMSFAVASNVQYRLKEVDGGTLVTLRHTALGLFPQDGYRDALGEGWKMLFNRLHLRFKKA
ncbi:MAG: SRPBCC domain-containing protein [Thermoanaerobaculia bacterium]